MSFFKNQSKLVNFFLVFFLIIGIFSVVMIPVITGAENIICDPTYCDPNGDGKIGLDVAIYALQVLAGLRDDEPVTPQSSTGSYDSDMTFKLRSSQNDTYTNSFGMTFKLIEKDTKFYFGSPADKYENGVLISGEQGRFCEKDQDSETIESSFYIQTTEVTQGQWKNIMKTDHPSCSNPCDDNYNNYPVYNVSWEEVQNFIAELNKNKKAQEVYRLPTEEEWECAARAGSATAFPNGGITDGITDIKCKEDPNLNEIGWYCGNSDNIQPVEKKKDNGWNLFDMHGNVREWCDGIYSNDLSKKVVKGGAFNSNAFECRSASRTYDTDKEDFIGFRVVVVNPPVTSDVNKYNITTTIICNDNSCCDAQLNIIPKSGYVVSDVVVDKVVSKEIINPYTFKDVAGDHTIEVTLKSSSVKKYIITATAGANGSIEPSGDVSVNEGASQTFSFTPNTEYVIEDVFVDYDSVDYDSKEVKSSYTFKDITKAHNIHVTFKPVAVDSKYIITATAGANGTISPSGDVKANKGENKTFNFTPNAGYEVADVVVDGKSKGVISDFTFSSVTANHKINVTFKQSELVPSDVKSPKFVWAWPQNGSVKVEWNGDAAASYKVYWNTTGNVSASDNPTAVTGTSFSHSRTNDVTYYYKVAVAGESNMSALPQIQVTPKAGIQQTITNSLGMTFKLIPPGTFLMGSPPGELGRGDDEEQHQVTITEPFYMQTTEVTQAEWENLMGYNTSWFVHVCGKFCPVERVSFDMVQTFIYQMNQRKEGIYQLPNEKEWEYAARAGSSTAFANGDITQTGCNNDGNLKKIGMYCWNSVDRYTYPTSSLAPNKWGLYDMHGNVWEWCQDLYEGEGKRVIRGGSVIDGAEECRSANRDKNSDYDQKSVIGFRMIFKK